MKLIFNIIIIITFFPIFLLALGMVFHHPEMLEEEEGFSVFDIGGNGHD